MSVGVGTGASRRLRWVAFGLAIATGVLAIGVDPADARRKRSGYNPPYASIVVDANTGAVLQATNADSRRHPASLAKVMTLYLLFERLESGTYKLSTPLSVSNHAAAQPPTKLGLKPGQTISVEDAILALVTKSANDIAVVIAESIGETEHNFARLMTRKARALGMARTTYTNASGLPDSDQITTARDQALLGRAIQERFPRYYHYFATEAFEFHGRTYRTHNRLLDRAGVDGIKTGFTRASGFNLLTSMRRGHRYVVAVVLGGRSSGRRDAKMRELLADHIMTASTRRTAPAVARIPAQPRLAAIKRPVPLPQDRPEAPQKVASVDATASISKVTAFAARPKLGSTDPIKPLLVRTVSITPASKAATLAKAKMVPVPLPPPQPVKIAAVAVPKPTSRATKATAPEKPARTGWMIQVGAFDEKEEALKRLSSAQSRAKTLLGNADPFTEPVEKKDKTLYRARFAGLDQRKAEAACRALKRKDIACFTLRN